MSREEDERATGPGALRPELAALAEQVRRLVDAVVSADAPPEVLERAARAVERLGAELRAHVPEPKLPRYPGAMTDELAELFPYDPIVGPASPLAPPLRLLHEDGRAVARVTFGTPYEGPPGCVHGGVIAACFDQVLNVANLLRGVPGPTRRLEVRYLAPTPLGVELRFEGRVEAVEGREVTTRGRLLAGDVLTAEAEGAFIQIPYERVMSLLEPEARPAPPPPEPDAADEKPGAPAQTAGARSRAAARRRRFRATGDGT